MLLRGRACAKINLGLKIAGRRADGFHELRTVFQTVALADRVEIELDGRGDGVDLEARGLDSPAGVGNLAYRAAVLGAPVLGVRGRIHIRLTKHIPSGAGLGGGSSDAATVLRLLAMAARRQRPARRPEGEGGAAELGRMLELAAKLGSDVAPFLLGGTVLGLGRGNEVYALADLGRWPCVLAIPCTGGAPAAVSTPEAFAQWDREHPAAGESGLTGSTDLDTIKTFCSLVYQVLPAFRPVGRNRGASRSQMERRPKVQAGIENDFQAGVFSLSPDFPRIHQQLQRSQAVWAGLSGSGAAQFGLFAEAAAAARAAARLGREARVWSTRFVGRAEYGRGFRVVSGK